MFSVHDQKTTFILNHLVFKGWFTKSTRQSRFGLWCVCENKSDFIFVFYSSETRHWNRAYRGGCAVTLGNSQNSRTDWLCVLWVIHINRGTVCFFFLFFLFFFCCKLTKNEIKCNFATNGTLSLERHAA